MKGKHSRTSCRHQARTKRDDIWNRGHYVHCANVKAKYAKPLRIFVLSQTNLTFTFSFVIKLESQILYVPRVNGVRMGEEQECYA